MELGTCEGDREGGQGAAAWSPPNPFWCFWGGNPGFRFQEPPYPDWERHMRDMYLPPSSPGQRRRRRTDSTAPREESPPEQVHTSDLPISSFSITSVRGRRSASFPLSSSQAREPTRPPRMPRAQASDSGTRAASSTTMTDSSEAASEDETIIKPYPVNIFLLPMDLAVGTYDLCARLLTRTEHAKAVNFNDSRGHASRASLLSVFCNGDQHGEVPAPRGRLDRPTLAQLHLVVEACCATDHTFGKLLHDVRCIERGRGGSTSLPLSDMRRLRTALGPFPWDITPGGKTKKPGQGAVDLLVAANHIWAVKVAEHDAATAQPSGAVKPGGGMELEEDLLDNPFTYGRPSFPLALSYDSFSGKFSVLLAVLGEHIHRALWFKVVERGPEEEEEEEEEEPQDPAMEEEGQAEEQHESERIAMPTRRSTRRRIT